LPSRRVISVTRSTTWPTRKEPSALLRPQGVAGFAVGIEDEIRLPHQSSRLPAEEFLGARVAAVDPTVAHAHHGDPRMVEDGAVFQQLLCE
jgi:hypothetical protein